MSTPVDPAIAAKITLSSSNDKIAFNRRLYNLEMYVANNVNPIEEQILLLREQLLPHYDAIGNLRREAESLCIHAPENLSMDEDGTVVCSFCKQKFHV